MDFSKIKTAVAQQFAAMAKHELFRTIVNKDQLWETYLAAFPAGSNPILKERTEHDCNCCKSFIRAVGNVVAIIDNNVVSIWDCTVADPNYQVVADAMAQLVTSAPIGNVFRHTEKTAGTDKNFSQVLDETVIWTHFFVNIPCGQRNEKNFVLKGTDIGPYLSDARAAHDVLYRSLTEITQEAVATVLDLIAQNSLYRGQEHSFAVASFQKLQCEAETMTRHIQSLSSISSSSSNQILDRYAWLKSQTLPASVAKIRNTSIGTLLVDL